MSRPTELQMLVALVDQAVEKLVRGPTSTTVCVGSLPSKMLTVVSWLGSKVSRSSLQATHGTAQHSAGVGMHAVTAPKAIHRVPAEVLSKYLHNENHLHTIILLKRAASCAGKW